MFKETFTHFLTLLLMFLFALNHGFTQESAQSVTPVQQQAVIDEISKLLNDNYVFPETAKKMADRIQERLKNGAYSKLQDPREFASAVMQDLTSISKDKHLGFHYSPEQAAEIQRRGSQDETEVRQAQEREVASGKRDNYGFRKVERLGGNVGYLDFRYFASADQGGQTAVAALAFLANCDAIIIDLRKNGGGDPTQIQLISSYFFEQPTHLNDIYTRRENRTENYWTLPYVPGNKLNKADLYVLTSAHTFSGAEEFSYNMKNLKRATLIGEVTGGGAHPTDTMIVQSKYILFVPFARAINPISKTNWEGTGVEPDIKVPADQAFDKAYEMALSKLQAKTTDSQRKNEIEWVLTTVKAKSNRVRLNEATLKKYVGQYQERKITVESGQLYYQRTGPKLKLIPLTETLFAVEGVDYFRLEFVVNDGKAAEVVGLYENGEREPSKRTG